MGRKICFILFLFCVCNLLACEHDNNELFFKVTDVRIPDTVDKAKRESEMDELLGKQIRVEIYETALKLFWSGEEGEESRAYIYEKTKDNEYIWNKGSDKVIISFEISSLGKIIGLNISTTPKSINENFSIHAIRIDQY